MQRQKTAKETRSNAGSWPIPKDAMEVFRERKARRGITITRSIMDALVFALKMRDAWF